LEARIIICISGLGKLEAALQDFLGHFEIEPVAVFTYFFHFEDFKLADLAGAFDVGIFAWCFVKTFDFYDSDFLH
jgi:hypothetical protein